MTNEIERTSAQEGNRLDPKDWAEFRVDMHRLLDLCLVRMQSHKSHPWQPPSTEFGENLAITPQSKSTKYIFDRLANEIMPTAMGNTHPKFWGWVNGGGIPVCVGAELVAATMNSNCVSLYSRIIPPFQRLFPQFSHLL